LTRLSPRLGRLVRTNSEVLNGVESRDGSTDFSQGIAITSGLFVDDVTHVELVRYPAGSDVMALLATVMVDGEGSTPRWLRWLGACARHPLAALAPLWPFGWARRTVICLVMQTLDNHIELDLRRIPVAPWRYRLASRAAGGRAPTYIRSANEAARALARRLDGVARNAFSEVVLSRPMTAHILGGCAIGADPERGVVDRRCRVFGYEDLFVVDGAAVPANLGVNPSLTITALAEHALSHVPARGEAP
jgi:cholesterol oxidase